MTYDDRDGITDAACELKRINPPRKIKAPRQPIPVRPKPAPKSASLVPFPPARRADLVQRIAARMAKLTRETAERHLRRQLEIQAETMHRRGFAEHTIERELCALRAAVRAAERGCGPVPDDTSPEIA
jgi:hypothetical protein